MSNKHRDNIVEAYEQSQEFLPFFRHQQCSSLPLTYQDSLSPAPIYPFCALGVLSAEGEWGSKKGIAFVVGDNYLLTCASNCYQHGYGKYPNITFTIDSNRKSGDDAYKISEVFIPQEYINLNENERNSSNYALLYIEGEQTMGDRYGIISITIGGELRIQTNQLISFCQEKFSSIASGAPLLRLSINTLFKKATGLIIQSTNIKLPTVLHFDQNIFNQLNQWAKGQINKFDLRCRSFYFISTQDFDESGIQEKEGRPLQYFIMERVGLKDPDYFFEHLPYSSIVRLYFTRGRIGDNLTCLKLNKFRGLRQLSLINNQIGPLGCKLISSLSFDDLRKLTLDGNHIDDEGCKYFSSAKWPYLTKFSLYGCGIGSKGLLFLSQQKWKNLTQLYLGGNYFDSETSSVLEMVNPCRIWFLGIDGHYTTSENLMFLKSPSWKSLRQLSMNSSNIGNRGCKMIKQANIPFTYLSFYDNSISCIGVKWLCKANLSKLQHLELRDNRMRNYGCLFLSLANMPRLNVIEMSIKNYSGFVLRDERLNVLGFQLLLKSDWVKWVGYYQSCLNQMAEDLKRQQLLWWNWQN